MAFLRKKRHIGKHSAGFGPFFLPKRQEPANRAGSGCLFLLACPYASFRTFKNKTIKMDRRTRLRFSISNYLTDEFVEGSDIRDVPVADDTVHTQVVPDRLIVIG